MLALLWIRREHVRSSARAMFTSPELDGSVVDAGFAAPVRTSHNFLRRNIIDPGEMIVL